MGSRDRSRDRYSRSRSRERRRSRSRDRSRRDRSRSRERHRSRSRERSAPRVEYVAPPPPQPNYQAMQAAMLQQQQQALQQQLLAQALLQQQAMAAQQATPQLTATQQRKAREIYIGNLAIGTVSPEILREFFNAALAGMVPDPVTNPPCINVNWDGSGRFAFVEFRTPELATAAMMLDKVELCGRAMNVGRPKGYVEPPPGYVQPPITTPSVPSMPNMMAGMAGLPGMPAMPMMAAPPAMPALPGMLPSKLGLAQAFAAQLGAGTTAVVLMENLLPVCALRDDKEYKEVYDDVYEEAKKCGNVVGVAIPRPPSDVAADTPCRIYIKYASALEAKKCRDVNNGRYFDQNKITANFVSEDTYNRAAAGEWIRDFGPNAGAAAAATAPAAALPPPPTLPAGMSSYPPPPPVAAEEPPPGVPGL